MASTATQTIRGTVLDAGGRAPVVGATVIVLGMAPALGGTTDAEGRFRLPGVPVGRVKLRITSVGYEDLFLNEVTVNAGKEVVLELGLTERLTKLDEVQVVYKRGEDARVTNNEMATVSARPFSPLEANRYAGALGDPARMAQNFAGVSSANDTRNDIVVRGNSPASRLWRLEGVNQRLERLLDSLPLAGKPYKTRFLVESGAQLLPLETEQVAYFLSRHELTTLVARDGRRFVLDYTLESLEKLLDPTLFFRANRQLLLHLSAVRRLHPYFNGKLKLDLQPEISDEMLVSREKAPAFKAWLEGELSPERSRRPL